MGVTKLASDAGQQSLRGNAAGKDIPHSGDGHAGLFGHNSDHYMHGFATGNCLFGSANASNYLARV